MTCIFAYQRVLLLLLLLTLGSHSGDVCDIHIQIGQHHIKVFRLKAELAEIGVYRCELCVHLSDLFNGARQHLDAQNAEVLLHQIVGEQMARLIDWEE